MFYVVGLTLDDISSGALPQVRLADALDACMRQGKARRELTQRIVVYTTEATDTQSLVARAKYKEQGGFLVFLYFSEGAVEICKEFGIPLRVVDRVEERGLPSNRIVVLEHPSVAPALS